jgi:hypothetical protein
VKYKHFKVPATQEDNNAFGKIEHRISRGALNPADVYLWALKIHVGFIFRDSSLRFDIKDQSSPFVLDVADYETEVALFRMLYSNWKAGGTTAPCPFGSVFVLNSLLRADQFDFFHCYVTGVVGIHLGGQFIVVFLWDQGEAERSSLLDVWLKYHVPSVRNRSASADYDSLCYMAHHVWACEGAYALYRRRRPFNLLTSQNRVVLIPPMGPSASRAPEEAEFRFICGSFGLDLAKFNGDTHNIYIPHPLIGK